MLAIHKWVSKQLFFSKSQFQGEGRLKHTSLKKCHLFSFYFFFCALLLFLLPRYCLGIYGQEIWRQCIFILLSFPFLYFFIAFLPDHWWISINPGSPFIMKNVTISSKYLNLSRPKEEVRPQLPVTIPGAPGTICRFRNLLDFSYSLSRAPAPHTWRGLATYRHEPQSTLSI